MPQKNGQACYTLIAWPISGKQLTKSLESRCVAKSLASDLLQWVRKVRRGNSVSHVKQNGAFSSLVAALTSSVSCKDTQRLMSEPRPQLTGIGRAVTPAMWYRLGVPPVQLRPPAPLYYHRSSSSPPPTTPAATQPRRRGLDQTQPSAGSKSRRGGNPLPSADAQLDVDFSPVDVHLTPGGVVHCVFVVNQIIVLRLFDCSSSSSALIMSFDWLHCFSRLPSITMKCNHAASCRHELPNTSVLWIW